MLTLKSSLAARAPTLAILACLVLGFWLRWPSVTAAWPYSNYVDEAHILVRTFKIVQEGTWDPGWYQYPSLPMYLIAGAAYLLMPVYFLINGHPLQVVNRYGYHDLVADSSAVLVAGRIVTLLLSLGGVWLAARMARRLAGPEAGVLAALLATALPALVTRGGIIIVDTFAAFFVLASLNAAMEIAMGARRPVFAVLCGLFAGWAFTSKYPSGAVILAVVPVALLAPVPWVRRVEILAWSGMGLFLGMFTGMPALFLRTGKVIEALRVLSEYYTFYKHGSYRRVVLFPTEVGIALVAISAIGLIILVVRRKTRVVCAGWLLYAALFLAAMLRSPYQPFRNVLPLILLGSVPAATLPWVFGLRQRYAMLVSALVVVLSLAAPTPKLMKWWRTEVRRQDSRTQTVDWLATHVRPTDRIVVFRELAVARTELERIPGRVRELSAHEAAMAIRSGRANWVLTAPFCAGNEEGVDARKIPHYSAFWVSPSLNNEVSAALREVKPVTEIGETPPPFIPRIWHQNRMRISIYTREKKA